MESDGAPRRGPVLGTDWLSDAQPSRREWGIEPIRLPPEGGADTQIGERGSAKDFLNLLGASITYHGAKSQDGNRRPQVHVGEGIQPVKVPAVDAFFVRKPYGHGQAVCMTDAADFSRQGLGHCFARPWKAARARYETIFRLLRDVLRIAPADRRFYGIL